MPDMKVITLALCSLCFSQPGYVREHPDETLTIFTENLPPLNYEKHGEASGLSVDLLLEIFNRSGIKGRRQDVVVAPWSRGYAETQRRENTVLFSAVRTPFRENSFKWVGPIGVSRQVLVARKDQGIKLAKGTDFSGYKYGIMKRSSGEQRLLLAGADPSRFIYVNTPQSAAHLLVRGRVDAIVFDQLVAFWVIQSLGYKRSNFEIVYAFDQLYYYYAFSKQTDDALIGKMQIALDVIRSDGTLATIAKKHLEGASDAFLQKLE
ncbi:MAG: transporter substrate-binding domain-containing protein [Kordiimonadaceae bacterium]|nr:transporter substrate-binding domain-containing protein [Kordiimonadaceae bacterium]MBL4790083.1 transporter substrate-binding domain-containing protein [Kordiimonadaceae bacterium]